jgi:hypothetical protein
MCLKTSKTCLPIESLKTKHTVVPKTFDFITVSKQPLTPFSRELFCRVGLILIRLPARQPAKINTPKLPEFKIRMTE